MLLFLFFIIGSYFLIPAFIAQIFNSTVELLRPTGKPVNEANAEIETQTLTDKTKIRKCSK